MKVYFISLLIICGLCSRVQAQTTLNDAIAEYNKGAEALKTDKLDSAMVYFQRCVTISSELGEEGADQKAMAEALIPQVSYKQALAYYKEKRISKALEEMLNAKTLGQKYSVVDVVTKANEYLPQFYYANGNELVKSNDYVNALANYDKAIEMDPNFVNAWFRKGMVYRSQKDEASMVAAMDKVISIGPATEDAVEKAVQVCTQHFVNTAKKAMIAKNYADAVENFESSLKYNDKNVEVFYLMTTAHNQLKAYDKAIETADKGLTLTGLTSDETAGFNYEKGNAYNGKGDKANACTAYKNALTGKYAESAKYQVEVVLKCQ